MKLRSFTLFTVAAAVVAVAALPGCKGKRASTTQGEREQNAIATYVAPGEKDEYYLFYSGGHSGQVYVAGIPPCDTSRRSRCLPPTPRPVTDLTTNRERCLAVIPGGTCITRLFPKPPRNTTGAGSS